MQPHDSSFHCNRIFLSLTIKYMFLITMQWPILIMWCLFTKIKIILLPWMPLLVNFSPTIMQRAVVWRSVGSYSAGPALVGLLSPHWLCHSSCDSVRKQRALFMSPEGGKSQLKFQSLPLKRSSATNTHCIMSALSPWKAHLEMVHIPGKHRTTSRKME